MFRNDKQTCDVIRVLLRSVRLERLWTESGPTPEATQILETRTGPLSHGEGVMVLIAFELWNGLGKVVLGELLDVLDAERLQLLGTLLVALAQGPTAVDRWLIEQRS